MTSQVHFGSPSPGSASTDHQSPIVNTSSSLVKGSMSGNNGHLPMNHDMQTQLEQSMQRSVTLVFWYKPHNDPIRLHHTVSTFPYFQLSTFSSLTSDLGLSPTSYVDSYNPLTGRWEQSVITAVRVVETEQRLLYRTRKSLLEGLNEEECLDLREELEMQPRPRQLIRQATSRKQASGNPGSPRIKRAAPDSPDSQQVSKYHIVETQPVQSLGFTAFVPPLLHSHQGFSLLKDSPPSTSVALKSSSPPIPSSPPSPARSRRPSQTYVHINPGTSSTTDNASPIHSQTASPNSCTVPIPYHPHPPLKRWPNDYTVSEIADGFRVMDALVATTPTVVQRTAFERVFGCRYVKSTVCRHRGVWRKADPGLVERFIAMGSVEEAVWGEFVRQVEGRPAGKTRHNQAQSRQPAFVSRHSAGPLAVVQSDPRNPTPSEEDEEGSVKSLVPAALDLASDGGHGRNVSPLPSTALTSQGNTYERVRAVSWHAGQA